ncbi:MAG: LPXTG cell wall anchor domain-containing protein [Actinobacteria bacterium]|nr:LPXTG cell wall anchor domain-containing protein [Actinomycetota bacterium]
MIKRILLFAAALALAATPGVAQAQYANGNFVAVSDTTATPGQPITISGCCFAGEVVLAIAGRPLGTVTADNTGVFDATVTVPSDLAPGAYTITATGQNIDGSGQLVLSFPFTVVSPGAADTDRPGRGTGTLPRTGADAFPLAQGGLALVLVGAGAVFSVRNRRNANRPDDKVGVSS